MKINVEKIEKNTRLDKFLAENLPELSRSGIKKLLDEGHILLNKKIVKAGTVVKVGDVVEIELPEPKQTEIVAENIPLDVVYEDDDLLVINKPQGMVVHPASGNFSGTLVNALLYSIKDLSSINGDVRPGIVHRLDKDTSGLMLVAKNDFAHRNLAKQISEKTCVREYVALLEGNLKQNEGEICTQIGRDPKDRKKMAVLPKFMGRTAITDFWVEKHYSHYTLVKFRLKTGRTHQIRVHAKHIGHAVVGDPVYNKKANKFNLNGQLLHSRYIEFTQPTTKKRLHFECELPKYFSDVLEKLD